MKKFVIILLLSLFTSLNSAADNRKPNIVTTIPPIASLIKMLVLDSANVSFIQKTGSCPHHHSPKPSDVYDIVNADYLIYIDDKFENYINNSLSDTKAKVIKISNLKEIGIRDKNYHIWLDANVAVRIMQHIKEILQNDQRFNASALEMNFLAAKSELNQFIYEQTSQRVLMIGSSLEYFKNSSTHKFMDTIAEVRGLGGYRYVQELVSNKKYTCIFYDEENDISSLKNSFHKLIIKKFDVEQWHVHDGELQHFYVKYLSEFYNEIEACK